MPPQMETMNKPTQSLTTGPASSAEEQPRDVQAPSLLRAIPEMMAVHEL
jgi:hypothetical protein